MMKRLVYAKHSPQERCGVAYFAQVLAIKLGANLIHSFQGYSKCDELFINMDIFELDESELSSLLNFISSPNVKKVILIMHDYRFSYLEDELIKKSDLIVNLSGEPALKSISKDKMVELFTPASTELSLLGFKKAKTKPLSLAFGFFSPRKKSFKMYVAFYEYMLHKYPDWYHILVASVHTGHNEDDVRSLSRYFDSQSVLVLNFLPNVLLSELISASDLGVCFYPTGIMLNNAAPMAFFSQGKPVITTYGELTPKALTRFTLDVANINKLNLSSAFLKSIGKKAHQYYWKNLSWDIFIEKMHAFIIKIHSR